MRAATSPESLLLKYRQSRSGVRFATRFLLGRTRGSLFTLALLKKLTLDQTPVITVTGKAYFDVGHSLKDQRANRRSHLPDYAALEIHPVMKLEVSK
jgi:hypothetical protein